MGPRIEPEREPARARISVRIRMTARGGDEPHRSATQREPRVGELRPVTLSPGIVSRSFTRAGRVAEPLIRCQVSITARPSMLR
jgi:hypothetical protein